ncbi:MAG: hypothetical protein AAGG08_20035 [Actinomycetota bacterium]
MVGNDVVNGNGIVVTGGGFTPLIGVTVTFNSDPVLLGEFPVAADGSFEVAFDVPDVAPGLHHLVVLGVDDGRSRSVVVPVVIAADGRVASIDGRPIAEFAPDPEPVGGLPATGGTVGMLLAAALASVLLGGVIHRSTRRRLDVR